MHFNILFMHLQLLYIMHMYHRVAVSAHLHFLHPLQEFLDKSHVDLFLCHAGVCQRWFLQGLADLYVF